MYWTWQLQDRPRSRDHQYQINYWYWPWKRQHVFCGSGLDKAKYFIFDIKPVSTCLWLTSMATRLIVVPMLSTCVPPRQPEPGYAEDGSWLAVALTPVSRERIAGKHTSYHSVPLLLHRSEIPSSTIQHSQVSWPVKAEAAPEPSYKCLYWLVTAANII